VTGATHEGDPARLDVALVAAGLARSRNHAATLIREGRVSLAGRTEVKPAAVVAPGARLGVDAADDWVSRAALKLVDALDGFGIDPAGRTVLDAGASTGGFTQVLLHRGARRVIAVDVGHGQLSPVLAPLVREGRLVSLEGVNVRALTPAALAPHLDAPLDLVVADLSFIPLPLVLPAFRATAPDAELVVLIKPQFEVGRGGVREGVVRDGGLRSDAIAGVLWAAHDLGLRTAGLRVSPIVGTHGNAEYLAHLSPRAGGDPSEWSERVEQLARSVP